MAGTRISERKVPHLCNNNYDVREATTEDGQLRHAKILSIDRIDRIGISETLDFNRAVLGDLSDMLFPQHLLKIEEEIPSKTVLAFVTESYQKRLDQFVKANRSSQKEALVIFDQVVKAVYSLYLEQFATRNLRTQHFVLTKGVWKLEALIYNHQYQQAEGYDSEYLWNPRYQAPECYSRYKFQDQQFNGMLVWNLGCILLQILLNNHKFSTLEQMKRFKGGPFSFGALGIKDSIFKNYTPALIDALAHMLHYSPQKRTSLEGVFSNPFLSPQVAAHFAKHKPAPHSKITVIGKSSVRMGQLTKFNAEALHKVSQEIEERERQRQNTLKASKMGDLLSNDEFDLELGAISTRIAQKQSKEQNPRNGQGNEKERQTINLEQLIEGSNEKVAKSLQLYKSYLDQSQLLVQAVEVMKGIDFPSLKPQECQQLKALIAYAVNLVALVNLSNLAQGFNSNINILQLPGEDFIAFSQSSQFVSFQEFVNFRRHQRVQALQALREGIRFLKVKVIVSNNPFMADFLSADHRRISFQQIKAPYRFVVKHAYDRISEEYNDKKKTVQAQSLARTAMYVTYCMTTDKLYIKEDIPDNFRFFFQWINRPPSTYVPLHEFKRYLDQAPKEVLIEHSRFILKKYYNI